MDESGGREEIRTREERRGGEKGGEERRGLAPCQTPVKSLNVCKLRMRRYKPEGAETNQTYESLRVLRHHRESRVEDMTLKKALAITKFNTKRHIVS